MLVDCLILADGAQVVGGKLYVLGGGWNTVWSKTFPSQHRMSVAVGLSVGWMETNRRHTFNLSVETVDNVRMVDIATGQFEIGRPPGTTPGTDQLFMVAINVDLALDEPRELFMVLSINNEELKRIPFRVVAIPANPGA